MQRVSSVIPDPFTAQLQREIATIAASVIKTSEAAIPSLLSAAAQTDSSPNQMLAAAIALILGKRLRREPPLADLALREDVLHEIGCRVLAVLERADDTDDAVRALAEERGGWNTFLGLEVATLVVDRFREGFPGAL